MSGFLANLQPYLPALVCALALVVLLLMLMTARLSSELAWVRAHYQALGHGLGHDNLEQLLSAHLTRIDRASADVSALAAELERLAARSTGCLQRVGLERYDAFDGVGGQVSFALALLDDRGNGVVLNSLFGRETSTVYAKRVQAGASQVALSREETAAVRAALSAAPRQPAEL